MAAVLGDVRCQRLAGGPFTQDTVAAGATLEINFLGGVELGLAHVRRTGGLDHGRVGRGGGLVGAGGMTHRQGQ
ncbi:hypothetical protein D3C84_862400 [compost metagenome]